MGYEEYVYVVVCFHAYSLLVNLINIFCFLIWNYFHIFAKRFKETGMDSQIFQLVLLEDARNFIRLLPQRLRRRFITISAKCRAALRIRICSRNWRIPIYGSFAPCTKDLPTACSLFGILAQNLLWWQHMGYPRKCKRHPRKR